MSSNALAASINSDIGVEVPGAVDLCLTGFFGGDDADPIAVRVVAPNGGSFASSLVDVSGGPSGRTVVFGFPSSALSLHAGDALGDYTVIAKQRGQSAPALARLQVRRASSPRFAAVGILSSRSPAINIDVCKCPVFAVGDQLSVEFGGFSPGETAPIRLYGPTGSDVNNELSVSYRGTLGAKADSRGEGVISFDVDTTMPSGCYQVESELQRYGGLINQFCVR